MNNRVTAFRLWDCRVGGETQALISVLAPPAGVRRRAIIRINDVTSRATARSIIARMIVAAKKTEERIVKSSFLQTEENRIGAVQCAESALGQAAVGFTVRFLARGYP